MKITAIEGIVRLLLLHAIKKLGFRESVNTMIAQNIVPIRLVLRKLTVDGFEVTPSVPKNTTGLSQSAAIGKPSSTKR